MSDNIISKQTQLDMYRYLLSDKGIGYNIVDSDTQEYIIHTIKDISRKLRARCELYIRKSVIRRDENNGYRVKITSKFKFKSNRLIYDVLKQIGEEQNINTEYSKQISQMCELTDIDETAELGATLRKKLVKLCKIYLSLHELENMSSEHEDTYLMYKESWLCEQAISKFVQERYPKHSASQVQFRADKIKQPYVSVLKPDLVVWGDNKAVLIDIKVYSKIFTRNPYNKKREQYISNTNRYQVNSYIGKVLESHREYSDRPIIGVLMHITNDETYNTYSHANGTDLSVENERQMRLSLIHDNGMEGIFQQVQEEIQKFLSE